MDYVAYVAKDPINQRGDLAPVPRTAGKGEGCAGG